MREGSRGTQNAFKHGMQHTGVYSSWQTMKRRCLDPKHKFYKNYGAVGITVCDRWLDFRNFYKDMGDRPAGYTIERLDNSKSYQPDNCKWGTRDEQGKNRSCVRYLTYKNETKTLIEFVKQYNVSYKLLDSRIYHGWNIIDAIEKPVGPNGRKKI